MARTIVRGLAVAAFSAWAASARGEEHLVDAGAAYAAVARAAAERNADVATIQQGLSTPGAARAARGMGVPLDRVRAAVPTLSDAELRELAERAAAVPGDPVAGKVDPWVNDVLVVVLIVGIVVLVLSAV
jgi:hypothetical protein